MDKIRKASREAAAKKSKSLTTADPHQKVDSSTWTPPEALNAGVKTGMRPISPRAYKRGGKVCGDVEGKKAKVRADRKARKSGGRAGEQPPVDRHINRDLKKANEYRDGTKHIGGMKKGGRVHKDDGGGLSPEQMAMIRRGIDPYADERPSTMRVRTARPANVAPQRRPVPMPVPRPADMMNKGGRTKKDIGGGTPYDVSIAGMPQGRGKALTRTLEYGFKKGGKVPAKQMGGLAGAKAPRAADLGQALALRKRMMSGMPADSAITGLAPHMGRMRKDGGKAGHPDVAADKALIKKMVKPSSLRTKKEDGGSSGSKRLTADAKSKIQTALGGRYPSNTLRQSSDSARALIDLARMNPKKFGAGPGPFEPDFGPSLTSSGLKRGGKAGGEKWIQKAIKHPGALHKQLGVPAGEKIPAKKLAAAAEKGGKLGKRARLAQTLRGMHANGGSVFEGDSKSKVPGVVGGRQARKAGGRTKGKTNINIVVSPSSAQQPTGPMIPGAALPRVPGMSPAPMMPPMAPPMGPPPGGMPPMAGGAPMGMAGLGPMAGGMPPMARKSGGRVYKSYKDMDAGAGSGEGRLEKTEIAERSGRKAGGRAYHSYKDMDAGAGSGEGRLEKTEIQQHRR